MSLREEQCKKVCRILDDVLENRPTERDSLIVAVRKAFAEPKRIRGKWIEHEHGYWTFVNADGERDGWIPDYECDQCGSRGWKEVAQMNFCPNCGADMRGEQDENR